MPEGVPFLPTGPLPFPVVEVPFFVAVPVPGLPVLVPFPVLAPLAAPVLAPFPVLLAVLFPGLFAFVFPGFAPALEGCIPDDGRLFEGREAGALACGALT